MANLFCFNAFLNRYLFSASEYQISVRSYIVKKTTEFSRQHQQPGKESRVIKLLDECFFQNADFFFNLLHYLVVVAKLWKFLKNRSKIFVFYFSHQTNKKNSSTLFELLEECFTEKATFFAFAP